MKFTAENCVLLFLQAEFPAAECRPSVCAFGWVCANNDRGNNQTKRNSRAFLNARTSFCLQTAGDSLGALPDGKGSRLNVDQSIRSRMTFNG